jgi:hypothetical protein
MVRYVVYPMRSEPCYSPVKCGVSSDDSFVAPRLPVYLSRQSAP